MEEDTGSNNTGGNKHFLWTANQDALLVECLMELQGDGDFKQDSNLKWGAFKKLEAKLEEKAPGCGIKAYPHIQSRMKTLKSSWQVVYDMIHGANASGFGWDSKRKCVYANDAVWDEYIKSKKKAAAWRNKPFPHYEALTKFWAKDRATGQYAEDGHNILEEDTYRLEMPVGNEETTQGGLGVNEEMSFSEMPEEQGPEASSSSKKRKRGGVKREEKYIKMFKDLGKMMDLSINKATDKLCASIERTSNEAVIIAHALLKIGGLTPLELHSAHAKLASSRMLWMLFNDQPDEDKAELIRQLIMS